MGMSRREPARDVSGEACRKFKWRTEATREVVLECFTHGRYWPCDRGTEPRPPETG
ncbi:hypothetical protein LX16_4231 [Stackebrandtia albiflava]|uniref:Uncharacterized protein n=1 Tax=Stackebrandtia albiflava TaxID=406432 RepID=A0A562UYZ1_9ACTN|nr:hypothetical protein LX16_4231 [Stackebrandtia albiflava]